MEALPRDIRNLPNYYVPSEIFICTSIILIFFLTWTLGTFFVWLWRSKKHIHNYQYIADHNIRKEFEHAKKTYKEHLDRLDQNENLQSQSSSNTTHYSPELEQDQKIYNRQQSRILQFICLSVVVVININSFTCNIMEVISYLVAVLAFAVFNMIRIRQNIKFLRLLFFIPLIIVYIPFFIFKKELKTD